MLIRSLAVFAGLCLASTALAAPPAKTATEEAATAPAKKQAAPKKAARQYGAAKAKTEEPPPGVRVEPKPVELAKAQPKKSAKKKAAKKASKKAAKKKSKKEDVKTGRAALTQGVDKDQLAVDHLKNAGRKSPLALLSSYKETIEDGDFETAAILLRLAADGTPERKDVNEVNDLLGIHLDTQETQVLLEVARASRADTVIENVEERLSDGGAAPDKDAKSRIDAAHAAVETARHAPVRALAIYKRAVLEGNEEAASLALAAVAGGPANEDVEEEARSLLRLDDGTLAAVD